MAKILHIIDNMRLGWAQTVVSWIFEKQTANKDIFLYVLRKTGINIKVNHKNVIINNSTNKFNFPIFKLRSFIKKNDIKIIHCHLAKSQILWWLLKKLFFPKIMLIFHEHWEIMDNWKIYPLVMNYFKEIVNKYIAVSKASRKIILKKTDFFRRNIKVLHNFVNLDKFKKIDQLNISKLRAKYWLTKDDFVVWFASRLYEWKWYMDLLKASKILINKWYNFKFLIAWEWNDRGKIERYIKNNYLENNVQLVWFVNDMTKFYNIVDCFVFPSHRESLWLTWIEANACACPVVASDIEWLNEIMIDKKNALLFKKEDEYELANSIEMIYNNPRFKQYLIKNWLEEVKMYSLDKYLIDLKKIYEWF